MADGKRCVICGEDCTDRPRIKDNKGQYACRACVEKRKAQRPAAAPKSPKPAAGVGSSRPGPAVAESANAASLMERWASSSAEGKIAMGTLEQPKCPKCEHPMMPESVVCMGCGFNTQSGKKIHTRIQKADKDKSESGGGGGFSLDGNGALIAAFVAAFGLVGGAAISGEAAPLFLLPAAIWSLAAWIMMVVAAFKDGDSTWGVIGICTVVPCLGALASLAFSFYYCIVGSTRTVWKANYWLAGFALFGTNLAAMLGNPEFAEAMTQF